MERKLRRVQRWIDRCREACRMQKWQMALLEIESAKADLEGVRRSIWERAEAQETGETDFFSTAGILFRRGGVALFILFFLAVPLGVAERPLLLVEKEEKSLFFVTRDERELLTSLRKSLSSGALRFSEADFSSQEALRDPQKNPLPQQSYASALEVRKDVSLPQKEETPARKAPERLEIDEVLALVQVGERALRGSAIEVVTE